MSAGWQSKSFEACIEKVTYTNKILRKDFLDAGAFPVISQEDEFINGYWNRESDVFRVGAPVVVFGDHTRALKYVDFDFVLGADGVKILRPRDFLVPKYLFYFLQSVDLGSLGYARHYRLLKELSIAYPPLAEQQRIVAILDEAFEGIATARGNAEKNLLNARAIFESYLNSVFTQRGDGWIDKALGEFCSFENGDRGANYPSKSVQTTVGIPFINAGHLTERGIDLENMNYIPRERFNLLGAGKIRPRDILFCLRGSLGKFASVGDLSEGAIASSLVIVRPDKSVSDGYLLAYFRSHLCAEMIGRFAGGAAQPNLSAASLRQFVVPIPSPEVQAAVVEELRALSDETRRLESVYQRKLAAIDALRQSLLRHAFSGQL
ncbi:MAG: restriction endonuclease subunit S [Coriobacteriia bacterium]